MKPTNNVRQIATILMAGSLLTLSACGNNDADPETNNNTNNDTNNEGNAETNEITLDSAMGEVTLPANAERILAPYHEDSFIALDVTPVAKWAIGQTVQDYLESDLEDVERIEWNLPLEQVLNHEPELIILENNMESYEGTYEDYNNIAPTYVMTDEEISDWREQIETFGTILGKEDDAETIINEYDDVVESARNEISEAIGNESVAVIWVTGDQFYLFESNRHSAEVLYSELEVNQPAFIEDLGTAEDASWNPISLEALSELDADHVFLLAVEGEQGIDTLENSSVWQSTPAAQNDNVHIFNDPSNWTNKGLLASHQTIQDVLSALVQE